MESLRLSTVSTRLMRIAPETDLVYSQPTSETTKHWTIPKGTSIGMSPMFLNLNPMLYPDPTNFVPERWLEASELNRVGGARPKYLYSFGKGSRQCLGMK